MEKKFLLKLFWLILFIFLLNFLATFFFYWYWAIWWFDMFMHFLGGLWISLMAIWLYSHSRFTVSVRKEGDWPVIFSSFLAVLIISLLWEFFEFSVHAFITFSPPESVLDLLSDTFFALSGGMLGALYFIHKITKKQGYKQ